MSEGGLDGAMGEAAVTPIGGAGALRRLWTSEGLLVLLTVLQVAVIARALGPSDYGVYALAVTYVAFVFLVLDPRSADAVIRYLAAFRSADDLESARALIRALFLVDLGFGLVGLVLVAATSVVATNALGLEGHVFLLMIFGAATALTAPSATSRAVLASLGRFDVLSRTQMVLNVVRAGALIAVAAGGLGLTGIAVTLVCTACLETGTFVWSAFGHAERVLQGSVLRADLSPLRSRAREIVHFVFVNDLTTLAGAAVKQLDVLAVGLFAGPTQAGFFRLAKSVTAPAGNIATPVQTVLYPRLADAAARRNWPQLLRSLRRASTHIALPLAGLGLLAIPFAGPALELLAGKSFAGAVRSTQVLLIGVAISFATLQLRPLFLALGRLHSMLWISVATSVGSIAAFWIAAPQWGATGVACARTLMVFVASLLLLGAAWKAIRRADLGERSEEALPARRT
jgi:O-antigen/teichoic acid export membrane protein